MKKKEVTLGRFLFGGGLSCGLYLLLGLIYTYIRTKIFSADYLAGIITCLIFVVTGLVIEKKKLFQ